MVAHTYNLIWEASVDQEIKAYQPPPPQNLRHRFSQSIFLNRNVRKHSKMYGGMRIP